MASNDLILPGPSTSASDPDVVRPIPLEALKQGLWEVEIVYYTLGHRAHSSQYNGLGNGDTKKQRRGKVYKAVGESEYKCFEAYDGVCYWPGDAVYIETSPGEPFIVGTINTFKPTKRETISCKLIRYYRPEDIPEVTYSLLIQERKEHGSFEQTDRHASRELFSSEFPVNYSVSCLRGKCSVRTYRSLSELDAEHFTPDDAFFAYLCFNLDNSRLTAIHGTSRVGPRHQATLPPEPIADISEERDRDELLYQPTDLCPDVENEYIQRCRTHRTIRLLQLPNLTQLERDSRLGDLCMDDAITELHFSGYNVKKAQETMQRRDALLVKEEAMGSFLSSDDVKKFTKGIKTYGKNFARIQKELLPYHMREHLVTFYYMWKKSRDAARPRYFPRSRVVPKKPKNSTKASPVADFNDYPSASESDSEIEERACHHCYTTKSKNWHHAGAQKQLLCTECRLHFKKYGRMREVGERPPVPECLSRISPVDFEGGVRTRACKSSRQKNSRDRAVDSPLGDDKSSRKTRKRIQRSVDNSFTSRECTPSKMARTIPEEEVEKPIINGYTSGNSAASSPVETKDELMSCERPATNGVDPKPNTDVKPITNGISPVVPESNEVSKIKVNKVDSKPVVYSAVKLTIKHKTMSLDEIPTTSVTVKSVVPVVVKDEKENVIKIDLKEEINEGEDCFLSNEQVALLRTFYSMARVHQVSEVLPYEPGSFQRLTFVESDGQKISIFAPAVLERRIRCETGVTCARTDLVYLAEKNNQAWLQRREACRVQRQNQQKQRQNELEQQHAAAAQKAQQQAQQQMRTMSAKSQPVFSTASSSAMPTQSVIPPSSGIPGFDLNMMNGLNPTEIMLRAALAQQHQQMLLANPHMQVINMIEQQKHQEALRRQQQEQQQRMLEEQRQAQVAQQAQMAAVAAAQQQQMRLKAGLMSGMNPQALPGLMHPAMMQQAIMQQMLQQQAQIQQQQQVQIQQQQQVQMQQQQQAQMQQQQQAQIQQQQHAAVLQAEEQRKQQQRLKESQQQQQQQQQHQQQQRLVAARAQELQQQQQFAAAMQAQFQLQQQQQQQQQNSASNALQHFANMLHSQGINPNASAADNMAMMMMAAANQQANQQFTADQIAESYRKMAELTRTA